MGIKLERSVLIVLVQTWKNYARITGEKVLRELGLHKMYRKLRF
jgi:hypothetical protein